MTAPRAPGATLAGPAAFLGAGAATPCATADTVTTRGTRPSGHCHDVPFCRTEITTEAQSAAQRVLASGWVTMGAETAKFEEEFAAWLGSPSAVSVSSCTAAIELALTALRLPAGSPVLTPTLTFCGAVQAIVHAGLRPVLVDADERTLTVAAEDVAKAADRHGAAAMVIQHMAGYPVRAGELAEAAKIPVERVVADAAHGLGTTVEDQPVGAGQPVACFSFYATKNLPIGEGGAITTFDGDLAARLRRMRLHGMSGDAWRRYQRSGTWRYTVAEAGMKANFTDLQAAIGRGQLRYLDQWQRRRTALAATYDGLLAGVPGLELPPRPASDRHAWHLYIVRVHRGFGTNRDQVAEAMAQAGIGSSVHFIPVHHQPYFRALLGPDQCDHLPAADRVFPRLLSLPMYPGLTGSDVERVCSTLDALAARASRRPLEGTRWR